jgi:hypothetical protein
MKCPHCKTQNLVVLKRTKIAGLYYLECPTMDCWCVRVKEVSA